MGNTARSQEAAELLRVNALDFLNGGIELIFRTGASDRDAKMAVISIQTAVELFAKYRIVREDGFEAIIRKGSVPRGDLVKAAAEGHFSTLGFDRCLEEISKFESVGEWERHLFANLQKQRNTLIHFAGKLDVELTKQSVAGLLAHVLALFAAGQDRDAPQAETYEQFLEYSNFQAVTNHPEYLSEAFDAASADEGASALFFCWNCERETLTQHPTETYFCWSCGLAADIDVAGFADCWQCRRQDAVCYDGLNNSDGVHYGRCLICRATAFVRQYKCCDTIQSAASGNSLRTCNCDTEAFRL